MTTSGSEGYWSYANSGTLAATGSAALAFIEEGYLPGDGSYGDSVVAPALNYIFNRATSINIGMQAYGHPENYDNSLDNSGDGNGKGIYFNPGDSQRNVYTTGIVTPVVYALGNALGKDTAVGIGTVSTMTYSEVMRDVVDWYSWGQVESSSSLHRGGWRYNANYSTSDNSTAQWGSLPILYGNSWGLATPQFVKNELNSYISNIQHSQDATYKAGGSGYDHPNTYVNPAKTGGLMLELAAVGANASDPRLANALGYLTSMNTYDHWNQYATGAYDQWNGGHMNNPYAMWAVYKALETWGYTATNTNGTATTNDDFLIGTGIGSAAGGINIGQDWGPQTSLAGDWYSQYCDILVTLQNANGSWNGYSYWTGALAAGWYINILNATGAPEPIVPVPGAFLLGSIGLAFAARKLRRRKEL